MKKRNLFLPLFRIMVASIICVAPASSIAQRQMEKLDRGLIAVKSGTGTFLSWRLFGTEPLVATFGFNVYKGTTKLNASVITDATCYMDNSSGTGAYTVKPVTNGVEGRSSEEALVFANEYITIPLVAPAGGGEPNDASVGDVDGDGQYEIILKVEKDPKDNPSTGVSGLTHLQAYKLNGKMLWEINLGKNIRSGAHYTQYMVYDLDGDGCAEIACKTADGTVDGKGKVIGSATANYVNSDGKIMSGPEYFSIFDGKTGAVDTTVAYVPARGDPNGWGGIGGNNANDAGTNRIDRMLACVAYLDGVHPSVVMCRGYYGRSVLAAWDWRDGKLTSRWVYDSKNAADPYSGMGNHNISVGDVDQDGKDEIVYGSMCVDDNGKGLYTTGLRHGDAMHLGDFDPDRPGLEVFGVHENEAVIAGLPGFAAALFDAKTGAIIYGWQKDIDAGRACVDNIMPTKGGQCWWNADQTPPGLMSCKTGELLGTKPTSTNFLSWWDGDLVRELLENITISKYAGATLFTATGCSSNNGTKATPALSADILGDWREEVIFRTSDNKSLRIYTTTIPTTNRIYTLMHDPQYRLAIAWQNVGYNQPPHPGFYLGYGMTLPPPKPNIYVLGDSVGINAMAQTMPPLNRSTPTSLKVIANQSFLLPIVNNKNGSEFVVYNYSGKMIRKAVTTKRSVNLHADYGLPMGTYMVKLSCRK